jgi:protein-disulfide isomerase
VAAVIVALALAAAFGIPALLRQSEEPRETPTEEVTSDATPVPSASAVAPSPDSETLTVPTVADASGGILVNVDGTVGGTPPPGAVRVDVYLDLLCPICRQFEAINRDTLATMRADGTVAVYYHPVSILNRYSRGTEYPTRAASALTTVAEYDPAHFEAFFAALFDNQPEENSEGLSDVEIAQIAKGVGVPLEVTATFAQGQFEQWVTDATDAAIEGGLQWTPTIRAEQAVEIDGGIWSNTDNLATVLQYIHDNGLQAYLDATQAA